MNLKSAEHQLMEAQRLLRDAGDLLRKDEVTEADRSAAADLRERATKMKRDADLMRQIETEARGLVEAEEKAAAEGRASKGKSRASGGFDSFGDFVSALVEMKSSGRRDPRIDRYVEEDDGIAGANGRGQKAIGGTSGASGGFLIPSGYVTELAAVMTDSSLVLPRVTTLPMSARSVTLPVVDYTQSLAAGEPRQFGGVQAFYQDEGVESEESEPKFREFTLTAHELTVYTEANNSLLADSGVTLEAFLNSGMGMLGALLWKVEYKIFRGTGAGQPLGIVNAPCTISVERQTANAIGYEDLANLDAAAMPSTRLAWFAHISAKPQLRLMQDPVGNYVWGEAAAGNPATLLGYPVFFTDKLPKLGQTGDIVLADMSYYLFGDRQTPTLDVSTEANFRRNRTAYRLIHRHDGAPWMNAPLILADTTTEISPFVILDAAVAS